MIDDPEELARIVVDQGYKLHRDIGPGLLESVYEAVLTDRLRADGLVVETQRPVDIRIDGKRYRNA